VINLAYPGLGETVAMDQWQCIDAFHQKHMRFETWDNTQVLVDSFQNCYVLDNKEGATSFVTFGTELEEATDADAAADSGDAEDPATDDGAAAASRRLQADGRTLANLTVHIMRPYYTVDMDGGDIPLDKNQHIAL
jgi:hypothetical protein